MFRVLFQFFGRRTLADVLVILSGASVVEGPGGSSRTQCAAKVSHRNAQGAAVMRRLVFQRLKSDGLRSSRNFLKRAISVSLIGFLSAEASSSTILSETKIGAGTRSASAMPSDGRASISCSSPFVRTISFAKKVESLISWM